MSVRIREQTGGLEILPDGPCAPPPNWRRSLADAIRNVDELCDLLGLPSEFRQAAHQAAAFFPLVVPRRMIPLMRQGDAGDPILKQILPLADERTEQIGFTSDPVGDLTARAADGMLQKYSGRALLITTGVCAIHCRYCFRRSYPYAEEPRGLARWEPALVELAADPSIDEVILSGGDPLTLTDDFLGRLVARLQEIPHLVRLRVHTRLPIVLPERINDELLAWLTGGRLTPIVVVHSNHPNELAPDVEAALGRMVRAGVPVLNQAVLLRGVNDDAAVLEELCRRLVNLRVMPYYLHQLDRVAGAAHFEVPRERGLELIAELRRKLPGYAVPQFVQEVSGQPHKVPIDR